MPEPLFVCTPSKLTTFEDCPRRYRYTYVDRPAPPKGPAWAHNSLGASVHTALRGWYATPASRRRATEVARLLRATWISDGYRDQRQEDQAFALALGWMEPYVAALDPDAEPLGVERVVAVKTARLALSGRVDRIDLRPRPPAGADDPPLAIGDPGTADMTNVTDNSAGSASTGQSDATSGAGEELVIVDYKTGRAGMTSDDARGSRALALYAYASARVFRRPCHQVELHHLPTGTVAAHRHTDESLARHLTRATATAADIVTAQRSVRQGADPDAAFPTRTGPLCSWCDYRRHCPAGQDAPAREPWAGLPLPGAS